MRAVKEELGEVNVDIAAALRHLAAPFDPDHKQEVTHKIRRCHK